LFKIPTPQPTPQPTPTQTPETTSSIETTTSVPTTTTPTLLSQTPTVDGQAIEEGDNAVAIVLPIVLVLLFCIAGIVGVLIFLWLKKRKRQAKEEGGKVPNIELNEKTETTPAPVTETKVESNEKENTTEKTEKTETTKKNEEGSELNKATTSNEPEKKSNDGEIEMTEK